jgi:hypothetical protein
MCTSRGPSPATVALATCIVSTAWWAQRLGILLRSPRRDHAAIRGLQATTGSVPFSNFSERKLKPILGFIIEAQNWLHLPVCIAWP